jgi:hypothetical protein
MIKVDTFHGLPSQRHWDNESFTIKNNSVSFNERVEHSNTAEQEEDNDSFFQAIQSRAAP